MYMTRVVPASAMCFFHPLYRQHSFESQTCPAQHGKALKRSLRSWRGTISRNAHLLPPSLLQQGSIFHKARSSHRDNLDSCPASLVSGIWRLFFRISRAIAESTLKIGTSIV